MTSDGEEPLRMTLSGDPGLVVESSVSGGSTLEVLSVWGVSGKVSFDVDFGSVSS